MSASRSKIRLEEAEEEQDVVSWIVFYKHGTNTVSFDSLQ